MADEIMVDHGNDQNDGQNDNDHNRHFSFRAIRAAVDEIFSGLRHRKERRERNQRERNQRAADLVQPPPQPSPSISNRSLPPFIRHPEAQQEWVTLWAESNEAWRRSREMYRLPVEIVQMIAGLFIESQPSVKFVTLRGAYRCNCNGEQRIQQVKTWTGDGQQPYGEHCWCHMLNINLLTLGSTQRRDLREHEDGLVRSEAVGVPPSYIIEQVSSGLGDFNRGLIEKPLVGQSWRNNRVNQNYDARQFFSYGFFPPPNRIPPARRLPRSEEAHNVHDRSQEARVEIYKPGDNIGLWKATDLFMIKYPYVQPGMPWIHDDHRIWMLDDSFHRIKRAGMELTEFRKLATTDDVRRLFRNMDRMLMWRKLHAKGIRRGVPVGGPATVMKNFTPPYIRYLQAPPDESLDNDQIRVRAYNARLDLDPHRSLCLTPPVKYWSWLLSDVEEEQIVEILENQVHMIEQDMHTQGIDLNEVSDRAMRLAQERIFLQLEQCSIEQIEYDRGMYHAWRRNRPNGATRFLSDILSGCDDFWLVTDMRRVRPVGSRSDVQAYLNSNPVVDQMDAEVLEEDDEEQPPDPAPAGNAAGDGNDAVNDDEDDESEEEDEKPEDIDPNRCPCCMYTHKSWPQRFNATRDTEYVEVRLCSGRSLWEIEDLKRLRKERQSILEAWPKVSHTGERFRPPPRIRFLTAMPREERIWSKLWNKSVEDGGQELGPIENYTPSGMKRAFKDTYIEPDPEPEDPEDPEDLESSDDEQPGRRKDRKGREPLRKRIRTKAAAGVRATGQFLDRMDCDFSNLVGAVRRHGPWSRNKKNRPPRAENQANRRSWNDDGHDDHGQGGSDGAENTPVNSGSDTGGKGGDGGGGNVQHGPGGQGGNVPDDGPDHARQPPGYEPIEQTAEILRMLSMDIDPQDMTAQEALALNQQIQRHVYRQINALGLDLPDLRNPNPSPPDNQGQNADPLSNANLLRQEWNPSPLEVLSLGNVRNRYRSTNAMQAVFRGNCRPHQFRRYVWEILTQENDMLLDMHFMPYHTVWPYPEPPPGPWPFFMDAHPAFLANMILRHQPQPWPPAPPPAGPPQGPPPPPAPLPPPPANPGVAP